MSSINTNTPCRSISRSRKGHELDTFPKTYLHVSSPGHLHNLPATNRHTGHCNNMRLHSLAFKSTEEGLHDYFAGPVHPLRADRP